MRRAALAGVELEYELCGSGEPVVLLHWGTCAAWARPLLDAPALRDRYRLLSYDRAGFGGSSRSGCAADGRSRRALPAADAPPRDRAGARRRSLLERDDRAAARARRARGGAHAGAAGVGAACAADRDPVTLRPRLRRARSRALPSR